MVTHGVCIKANARSAREWSFILSPTRNFVATATRGVYFMKAQDEAQALRDWDFLRERKVEAQLITNGKPE